MCLAIPGEVMEMLDGGTARVRFGASEIVIDTRFIEGVTIGSYIIAHSGFAISILDEEEAKLQLELWKELL